MSDTKPSQQALEITTSLTADDFIEVAVCDNGCGIPIESESKIFTAFFTTMPDGIGMGLAISHSIIESHGGRLWMTANADRGVTFHFTVPMAKEGTDDDQR